MPLRIRRRADHDLDQLLRYGIETFGANAARQYYDELLEVLGLIVEHPRLGRERPDLGSGIRMHAHRSHAVFYRIDGHDVVLVRVLHSRQDWRHHLD